MIGALALGAKILLGAVIAGERLVAGQYDQFLMFAGVVFADAGAFWIAYGGAA